MTDAPRPPVAGPAGGGPGPAALPADHPVRRAVRWHLRAHPADRLLVAVSGGADSLALAAAVLAEVGGPGRAAGRATDAAPGNAPALGGDAVPTPAAGPALAAAVIDHGLQEGSAAQSAATAEALRRWGFADVTVRRVAVGADGGLEAAARTARYAALRELAASGGEPERVQVLLGHTMDDQAETVLLGLGRGSGPRSIAGMRALLPDAAAPASGRDGVRLSWGRPLLEVRRADTESACAAMAVPWWSDPHNSDARYTRVRLRREVLPLLDDVLAGGVTPALARTAELLADDLAALDGWAAAALAAARTEAATGSADHRTPAEPDPTQLAVAALAGLPDAVLRRVLRRWLTDAGVTGLTADHLFRMQQLVRRPPRTPPAAVRLPGGVDATRVGAAVLLAPNRRH
ncbi:tRNA lysidine(34) synthetase TilS [Nakamurella aerolata]|uniref:tRNA(Ile)-lysidine synthase n=1 Tax=Nakamurella aerolata TaxID=1656892 RepID=A0A849A1Q8_9ACTN|nr:tRNA lysidine(34) synthetase TilS [Nakamurella aerolata]NNG34974.1 tRNA lysidine(34) synthetase TilS [Nakamurella aerolata]